MNSSSLFLLATTAQVFALFACHDHCSIAFNALLPDSHGLISDAFRAAVCKKKMVQSTLRSCSLIGILRLKDVSLSEQSITSIAEDAFTSSRGLQRLSLSGNRLSVLPEKVFAPLDSLQLLDLGRLGLQQVESDTFAGLSSLRILSLSQNRLKVLPEDLLRPMPALEQLLLGGKSDEKGTSIVDGNELSVLSARAFAAQPRGYKFSI